MSATAWAVSGGLTLVAFVVMHTVFPVKSLATIYAPVLFLGGLSGIYACQRNGLYFTRDEASNAVIAATAGLVVALFAAVVVTRLVYSGQPGSPLQRTHREASCAPSSPDAPASGRPAPACPAKVWIDPRGSLNRDQIACNLPGVPDTSAAVTPFAERRRTAI